MILRSGILRPRRSWLIGLLTWLLGAQLARATQPSIARLWDEENIAAIRIDTPNPPVHARNLFHLSVAMYDVWAAFDSAAAGYLYHHKHTAPDVAAARREAISYAAYRILSERYALSRNAVTTLDVLNSRMTALGFDSNNFSTDPSTPAGLGNSVAALVSDYFNADGARQLQAYHDAPLQEGGYLPNNRPLLTRAYGTLALDPNHWQPLAITNAIDQHNIPASLVQSFLGAQWLGVRPFALSRVNPIQLWIDPGPPPQLGGASDADYRAAAVEVIRRSSELTPDDGVLLDISPGALGNNPLGANDGPGRPLNPVSGQPYAANVVKRGDFARVLAEFWADGPASETPPGHWNVIANQVADSPEFAKRIGGAGPVVDDLEWDVKTYFALNAALHDAACAAWSLKRFYNGWRPIEAIRWLGQRGQASDPAGPSYDAFGLPLVLGLIEVVTADTSQTGGRHEGMTNGNVVLHCWPGHPWIRRTNTAVCAGSMRAIGCRIRKAPSSRRRFPVMSRGTAPSAARPRRCSRRSRVRHISPEGWEPTRRPWIHLRLKKAQRQRCNCSGPLISMPPIKRGSRESGAASIPRWTTCPDVGSARNAARESGRWRENISTVRFCRRQLCSA